MARLRVWIMAVFQFDGDEVAVLAEDIVGFSG
jgi:hypothetical protein